VDAVSVTPARPDLAYVNAVRLSPAELTGELRDLLGAKLVAYLGGVKETRAVRQWVDGSRQPLRDPRGRAVPSTLRVRAAIPRP
jgi:hypothetical protein